MTNRKICINHRGVHCAHWIPRKLQHNPRTHPGQSPVADYARECLEKNPNIPKPMPKMLTCFNAKKHITEQQKHKNTSRHWSGQISRIIPKPKPQLREFWWDSLTVRRNHPLLGEVTPMWDSLTKPTNLKMTMAEVVILCPDWFKGQGENVHMSSMSSFIGGLLCHPSFKHIWKKHRLLGGWAPRDDRKSLKLRLLDPLQMA